MQFNTNVRAAALFTLATWCLAAGSAGADEVGDAHWNELDQRRLVGKAHYENDKFTEAAEEFRRCIALTDKSATDYFNLGLVLMRAAEYDEARAALEKARAADPDLLAAYYVDGIVCKRIGEYDKAVANLEHVIEHDPECMGAYYNLGVCFKFQKKYEQAVEAVLGAVRVAPQHPSSHYQLITLYRRLGRVDDAARHREIFDLIKDTVDESEKTQEALERSKYSYIIEAPRLTPDLEPLTGEGIHFVDVTNNVGLMVEPSTSPERAADGGDSAVCLRGDGLSVADYDGDGDLDVYVAECDSGKDPLRNRLYQNDGAGRFSDVTSATGVGDDGIGLDAIFGDYDNDGDADLYVVNAGSNVLYRNNGDGTFENVSEAARVDEPHHGRRAVFFDYDHDNDLDLFAANWAVDGGAGNSLLRNNGNGTFTDQTDEAGLLVGFSESLDAVFGDFDGDHDMDLFVVNGGGDSRLFVNQRMGAFKVGGEFSPPIGRDAGVAAQGDFNRDGRPDFLVAVGRELYLYRNEGGNVFHGETVPLPEGPAADGVRDIEVLDFNNDGWSDLLLVSARGEHVNLLAGAGAGRFTDVSKEVGLGEFARRAMAAAYGDFDRDGDLDLLLRTADRGLVFLENRNANPQNWINVHLVGKKVNKSGYGATVEIASGGHYQKRTYVRGPVHFGLGNLKELDVVRVTWPNGVSQNVVHPAINEVLTVVEYVKVSASCGFLYSYNGSGFELVNEILGIGPLGVPMAPGVYYPLDHTELTKIEAEQLKLRDGFYELRLTEELREITYADQITLRVVDRPAELTVIPNEMFASPPPEDKLYAVSAQHAPVSAVDDRGADVLPLILEHDGRFPEFPLITQYDGLAEPHSLVIDLGDLSKAERILLFLDAWIYWPESSIGMAIGQDPRYALAPLTLEVRDEQGRWTNVIESVGLPTSKGITVPLDLTGFFPSADCKIRLATNLCVYFDRVSIATEDEADRCRVTELAVAHADLHYRGFSKMTRDRHGFERFDYADVSLTGSWSPPAGMFTRYGEVTELLDTPDDMYVIFGPGDELAMRFDARGLPPLPAGWTRDFVFFADGWVKDGDLNTKFSERVTPLPFHGMSGYPYPDTEHYPTTPEHQEYLRKYNTRASRATVGLLTPTRR